MCSAVSTVYLIHCNITTTIWPSRVEGEYLKSGQVVSDDTLLPDVLRGLGGVRQTTAILPLLRLGLQDRFHAFKLLLNDQDVISRTVEEN